MEAGTQACGTVRSKRKGVPVTIIGHVDPNDSLFRKVNMTEGYMNCSALERQKRCAMLCNAVGDDLPHKSELINEYNNFMGGVDRNDQLVVYFAIGRKTTKWWKSILAANQDLLGQLPSAL